MADSSLGSLFGLGDSQGNYFKPGASPLYQSAALTDATDRLGVSADPRNTGTLNSYGTGQISLAQALNLGGNSPQFADNLATGATSGSQFATDQVQNNPILGQLYGQGGDLSKAIGEEGKLASTGYQLQPEDHEAYGQASDNIARMSGQQEHGLSQALADRGLGTGASGASGAMFSGVQGNKFEALAQAQTNIAQRRMEMNQQRLNDTRNYISKMGGQAEGAIQDQYGRQAAGAKQGADERNALMTGSNDQYGQAIKGYSAVNDANNTSVESEYAHKNKSLFDAVGNGLYQGTQGAISGGISTGAKAALL